MRGRARVCVKEREREAEAISPTPRLSVEAQSRAERFSEGERTSRRLGELNRCSRWRGDGWLRAAGGPGARRGRRGAGMGPGRRRLEARGVAQGRDAVESGKALPVPRSPSRRALLAVTDSRDETGARGTLSDVHRAGLPTPRL
jgi:hypothetical protein